MRAFNAISAGLLISQHVGISIEKVIGVVQEDSSGFNWIITILQEGVVSKYFAGFSRTDLSLTSFTKIK